MKNKHSIPDNVFCSFQSKGKNYNGMIIKASRKGFTIKYRRNNPAATNFYKAEDTIIIPENRILPIQK